MTEIEKAQELCEAWGMQDNNGYSVKDTFKTGFTQGARWQAKQSPWISVEERLPEKDGLRVWVKSSLLNYQPLVYSKGKFYARLSDGAYDGGVTHWMPIPGLLEGATNEQ